eukprot:2042680-Pyramimonas_sp.AAC.1
MGRVETLLAVHAQQHPVCAQHPLHRAEGGGAVDLVRAVLLLRLQGPLKAQVARHLLRERCRPLAPEFLELAPRPPGLPESLTGPHEAYRDEAGPFFQPLNPPSQ